MTEDKVVTIIGATAADEAPQPEAPEWWRAISNPLP